MPSPPTDQARIIAGKLSEHSRKALAFLDIDEARSPFELKCMGQRGGFTVLEALERRKLVRECGDSLGRIFSPHTAYRYRLTPLGLAVRRLLHEQSQ